MARQILGKVVPTGEDTYDNNRTYDELCIVMYNGQSYISKKETRGNKPDNTEYWQQLVEKPVKGTDYFTEADKDEIVNDVTNDATNKYNQAVTTGMEKFDQNAERKTSDFNANASEKTDTYNANADSAMKTFTNNANSKTEAYNTNATEKLGTYNSNHTAKLKEYNDNATSKLSAYNTNTVTKTTEYNSNHTDKLNAYDTNASNKVDAYNTNANARLEEYNTNANNKIAEYDEHSKELNNKIVSIGNDYRMVKDQLLYTGEDTDTFVHVEDSAMAEMKEIKVDGVCEQETTTGKNLLNINTTYEAGYSTTINGITYTINKDGSITAKGTATNLSIFNIFNTQSALTNLVGKEIILSGCPKGMPSGTFLAIYDDSYSDTNKIVDTGTGKTGTITTDLWRFIIRIPNGAKIDIKFYPMIRLSNITDDAYEPYTGGQPSPSLDYPQPIEIIDEGFEVVSCGKNLLDKTLIERGKASGYGVTGIIPNKTNNPKRLTLGIENAIKVKPNTTYTLTIPNGFGSSIAQLESDLKGLGDTGWVLSNTYTITTKSNAKYVGFNFEKADDSDFTDDDWNNFINGTLQFELGEPTEIEPYQETRVHIDLKGEFIGKISDTYKDTLRTEYFPEEGQYHLMLDKKAGKHVFTGDEDFTIMNPSSGIAQIRYLNSKIAKLSDSNYVRAISNYFTHNYSWGNSWSKDNSVAHWVGFSAIVFYSSNFSTVSDFKQFLKDKYDNGNPVVVYYLLATPYTLDLGVIDMPMSYKDITNIFTDSDLLPNINAKYYRVFDKTIQNAQINEKTLKQEITDLNATVSALDTRLKALENKTVEEPTESEGTV